ncbi:hypothetical protein O181_076388 [Austropuccinia psidii MF-1]|uniref:Uncharacterized protein n=1 Tax=Austropuccinia psidii MF-1 TaxID=1389203 RepID=A0A9Q3FAR3_9BASI|nr:hypothetical protein [Austropuccinia psidii MF-1]
MHVLRYLRGTSNVCISYKQGVIHEAVAYSNADWGNCQVTFTTCHLNITQGVLSLECYILVRRSHQSS